MAPTKMYALNTSATMGKPSKPELFRDLANEIIFEELKTRKLLQPRRIVDVDANRLGVRCFKLMRGVGLQCLLDMDELIYPTLVMEFYSNLQFEANSIEGKFYLRGITGVLTEKILAKILGYKDVLDSIKLFDNISSQVKKISMLNTKVWTLNLD